MCFCLHVSLTQVEAPRLGYTGEISCALWNELSFCPPGPRRHDEENM